MYDFYLDKILLPVAPSKLQIKIKNANKTIYNIQIEFLSFYIK